MKTKDEIISILKSFCNPKDYDLNDWDTIVDRVEVDDDGIQKYELSFLTLYLDKDYNYYDAEPMEVSMYGDDDLLLRNLTGDELLTVTKIKKYVLPKHYDLINWKIIFKRVEEVEEGIFLYPLGVMDLYLDKDLKPVNKGRCHIIYGDEFWYDFNTYPLTGGEQYTFISKIE